MKTKTRICSILLVVLLLLCGMSAHALAQQYDVIVAGSGMAGLSAALTAAQQGASVILFEKLGVMGGSTALSAGAILKSGEEGNAEGTPTVAEIAEYITELNNGNIDPALRGKVLGMGNDTITWIEQTGLPLFEGNSSAPGDPDLCNFKKVAPNVDENGDMVMGGGSKLIASLAAACETAGVTICLNSPVTALLTDETGAVTGVTVTPKDAEPVNYAAKSVVLATGSYVMNDTLIAEAAEYLLDFRHFGPAGDTGDAIYMGRAVGADTKFSDCVSIGTYGFAATGFNSSDHSLYITGDGERFVNETSFYSRVFRAMRLKYLEGTKSFFAIYDSTYTKADPEAAVAAGTMFKADTLEELAGLMGVDTAKLQATVDRYNANKGIDDPDFGKPAAYMTGLAEKGPYYASIIMPAYTATFGGLYIDENAHIMKADGTCVKNLYGAGACASSTFLWEDYPYSGTCILYAAATGRIAGENAALGK
ncbi:MAG: FAD-dependent oxidoreductase [Clostridia bacterium]|nr:FAD-dependent oxidoreductase [Clostridia bacterium]